MSKQRKTRGDSILGTLPEERQLAIAEHARAHTLAETVAWLRADGIKLSGTSLSQWLSSFVLQQQFRVAEQDSLNLIELLRKRRPNFSETELQSWANEFFQVQAVKSGDAETYLAFATARHKAEMDKLRIEQRERAMSQEREKWMASQKTKIDLAFDELEKAFKGNAQALEHFNMARDLVRQKVSAP